jgi:hypothetical protein
MSIIWRSDTLPPRDRFPAWVELSRNTHMPTEIRSEHQADFRATVHLVPLGSVQVSTMTYPSLTARRTPGTSGSATPRRTS